MDEEQWNPWRELRGRRNVIVLFGALPAGLRAVHERRGRAHVIAIHEDADQVERNHLLAHELVHIERGGGCPGAGWRPSPWGPVVMREEERVETIVARRLVPERALARLAWNACETEGRLDAWVVAEEFRVPQHVAERALWLLDPDSVPAPRLADVQQAG
ncbi:hypothetical protein [Euzebya sp.]|uniref:hypothetical protein n=1 Tax=Euzebya sp. TaxID=1971409 RepID=UPI00351718A4